jgi:DNA repair protein RadC
VKTTDKKPKLREKLQRMGSKNLSNEELLAILLGSGSAKLPVKKLAKKLLFNFPLNKIHLCDPQQLSKQGGIGLAKASKIVAAIEIGRRNALPTIEKITSPAEALPYLRKIRSKNKEHTMCLYLNASSELIHAEIVSLGGLNYTLLEPRDVLYPAITLPATAIILAHNHPSGKTNPSLADKKTTKKLIQVSSLLGIKFLDHLIVSKQAYFSFKEAGLLDIN